MPKDGLGRLPEKVAASLLRALESLPPRPEPRLLLKRPSEPRAPNWDATFDYDVFFLGRRVGQVWRHEYRLHPYEGWLWHWTFKNLEGWTEADGHALTLEAAQLISALLGISRGRRGWLRSVAGKDRRLAGTLTATRDARDPSHALIRSLDV